jgi:hypothetical protein
MLTTVYHFHEEEENIVVIIVESLFIWDAACIPNPLRPPLKTWPIPEFCLYCGLDKIVYWLLQ